MSEKQICSLFYRMIMRVWHPERKTYLSATLDRRGGSVLPLTSIAKHIHLHRQGPRAYS